MGTAPASSGSQPAPSPLPALRAFRGCQAWWPSGHRPRPRVNWRGRAAGVGVGRRDSRAALPRVCESRSSPANPSPWTAPCRLPGLVISCSFSLRIWAYTVLPGRFLQGGRRWRSGSAPSLAPPPALGADGPEPPPPGSPPSCEAPRPGVSLRPAHGCLCTVWSVRPSPQTEGLCRERVSHSPAAPPPAALGGWRPGLGLGERAPSPTGRKCPRL